MWIQTKKETDPDPDELIVHHPPEKFFNESIILDSRTLHLLSTKLGWKKFRHIHIDGLILLPGLGSGIRLRTSNIQGFRLR